jgi:hypothetical protein
MKILIQHIRTQLFLKTEGVWTSNPYEACDFGHSHKAIEFAEQHKLMGVQILVKFIDSHYDEAVPIGPVANTPQPHV